jgi:hypothetical protein
MPSLPFTRRSVMPAAYCFGVKVEVDSPLGVGPSEPERGTAARAVSLASQFEASSRRKGMGRNSKAAREWLTRRRQVEEELDRRRL